MDSQDKDPNAPSAPAGKKPRGRAVLRWFAAFCILIVIALLAALYWRVPLANAALEFGLARAGIQNVKVTVTSLSASRIDLTDIRLGNAIVANNANATLDLSRLPQNPVTGVTIDSLQGDLVAAQRELEKLPADSTDNAPAPTLRSLRARLTGLPDVTVRNVSLKYGDADEIVTMTGSVDAAGTGNADYGIRFKAELTGQIGGKTRPVAIDGTAALSAGSASLSIGARATDSGLTASIDARADMASDPAIFNATMDLRAEDLGTLAIVFPELQGAGGKAKVNARTTSPLSFGLDTPLDLPALAAALRKSGSDGIRLEAALENGSHGTLFDGVDVTVTSVLRGLADDTTRLQADGNLSLRARRAGTPDATGKNITVDGAYRIIRDDTGLTVSFPQELRAKAAQISSGDGTVTLAPVDVMLTTENARIYGFGAGERPQAEARLQVKTGATKLILAGTPDKRNITFAPLALGLTGRLGKDGGINARLQAPRLAISEKTSAGTIDTLEISIQHTAASVTGGLRGRLSAERNGAALLNPTPLEADISLDRESLTFNAKAVLPGAHIATATGQHDLSTGQGTASVDLPAFRMTQGGGEFRALAPSVSAIDIQSGTVRANARLAWTAKGVDGTGSLAVSDMNFADPSSGTTVRGLSAEIRLDRLMPPRTRVGQTLRIKSIGAGVTLNDLLLRFALIDGAGDPIPAVQIDAFRTGFAGGFLKLKPTVIDSEADKIQATVEVDGVDLSALLSAVGLENISGTGRLNGLIPVTLAGDAVGISGGRLAASKPGVLRIRSEAAKNALAQGGEEVTLMLSALEDFRYETLTLEIEKETAGAGRVVLRTRGQNPAVRDGQPFIINLNLSGNVDGLAAVLAQALQLPGGIVRTMLAK